MKTFQTALSLSFAFTLAACGGSDFGYELDGAGGGEGGLLEILEEQENEADGDGGYDEGEGDGDAGGEDDGADDDADDGDGDGAEGGDFRADGGGEDDGADDDGETACVPFDTLLIAGQNYDAGDVSVSSTDKAIVIDIATVEPWVLELVHVAASAEPIDPATDNAPGNFPFHYSLDMADTITIEIPFEEVGVGCGDVVDIAIHAEAHQLVDGEIVKSETAWADGEFTFENGWGSALSFKLCCPV